MRPIQSLTRAIALGFLLGGATSCSSSSSSASTDSVLAPEITALFGTLPAASPDKLRGVWSLKAANSAGTADLRMRFTDDKLVLGVRCEYTVPNLQPVVVGQIGALTSTDLDAKTGQFTLAATVGAASMDSARTCDAHFDAATWKFVVTGAAVEMEPVGKTGHAHFDKVGD